jgi:8-oxo-dGTP pyrophosphatase MutT (NUDIX family)
MLKLLNMPKLKIKQKVQIVVMTNDEVLLLKYTEKNGGIWQNATGSVEKNESFKEAAKRELWEETGIENEVTELPMVIKFHDRWGYDVEEKVFKCSLKKKTKITLSDEHEDYKWVELNSLTASHYGFENHFKAITIAKENIK